MSLIASKRIGAVAAALWVAAPALYALSIGDNALAAFWVASQVHWRPW